MFAMTDPNIQSYSRPLYDHEVANFGEMNLNDYSFNFGIVFKSKQSDIVYLDERIGRVRVLSILVDL